jgi:glutamine---fructose-6-phosphate transaminase (isomerizing)
MTDPGSRRDRCATFLDDVLAGPDELALVLDRHLDAVRALPGPALRRRRWRLVGMGSSRFAALDAASSLRAAGLDAAAEIASTSGGTPPGEDVLLVAISNSGRTREVVELAERHAGRSFIVALTRDPGSPLAGTADAVIPLVAERREAAGIASLSYRSTVAALLLLASGATGDPHPSRLGSAVPALGEVIAGRHAWLDGAADRLDGTSLVHVLGDGARQGTLEQAALLLREAPRLPALPSDTGEWLHVALYTLYPGDPVLLLAGSTADPEAVATIRDRGGVLVAVGPGIAEADVRVPLPAAALRDVAVRALVEPVVAELLAAELWRRTSAQSLGERRREA